MVDTEVCRHFGPFLLRALYAEANLPPGRELRLDVRTACDLMGIDKPTQREARHVRDVVVWIRDNPVAGWEVRRELDFDHMVLYVRPKGAPA